MTHPQQPPVMHGYSATPPQGDWMPPPAPEKKRSAVPWLIGALVVAVVAVAVLASMLLKRNDPPTASPGPAGLIAPTSAAPADVPATDGPDPIAERFKASDLSLTVKITEKACFGSAGCNVDYSIRVAKANPLATLPEQCEVTYEVRGLEDPQVGTLTLANDGKYTQDDSQSGQTPRSSTKLTAKITDLECR